jgi:FlaA1/EpsC-like NDP-sugar epimerase
MAHLSRKGKRLLFVGGDLLAVLCANGLAVALRFDFVWANITLRVNRHLELLLIDLVVTPLAFYVTGLYQSYWKYAGLSDLIRLVRAVAIRTVSVVFLFYALGFYGL